MIFKRIFIDFRQSDKIFTHFALSNLCTKLACSNNRVSAIL